MAHTDEIFLNIFRSIFHPTGQLWINHLQDKYLEDRHLVNSKIVKNIFCMVCHPYGVGLSAPDHEDLSRNPQLPLKFLDQLGTKNYLALAEDGLKLVEWRSL